MFAKFICAIIGHGCKFIINDNEAYEICPRCRTTLRMLATFEDILAGGGKYDTSRTCKQSDDQTYPQNR